MDAIHDYLDPYIGEFLVTTGLNILILLAALTAAHVLHALAMRVFRRSGHYFLKTMTEPLAAHIRRPSRWLFLLLALNMAVPVMEIPLEWQARLKQLIYPLTIASFGWLLVGIVQGVSDWIRQRYTWETMEDNLTARRINTQLRIFTRVIIFLIATITILGIAVTIPSLRNIGLSLFASAGVAGIAIGMAAKPALGNLIAGIQLALTQPIRLDDVVIVEGEWGRIEEITSTYVVVKIWDLRRLVVPLSYFIEQPFQNWSRTSTKLLGTVFLYMDYQTPVEAIREELQRLVEQAPQWNKEAAVVQVTDCKDATVEIRILVSANNAGSLFELRCFVREKMIEFLQREYPQSLPRSRSEIAFMEKQSTLEETGQDVVISNRFPGRTASGKRPG